MGLNRKKEMERELEGVNLLNLTPLRAADWEEVDGRVVVRRPNPKSRGIRGLLDRLLHQLSARRIRLDEVGSFAWAHLDGQRTVADIGELLKREFGERVDPVEERLGRLIWALRREGLVGYPGWDEGTDRY